MRVYKKVPDSVVCHSAEIAGAQEPNAQGRPCPVWLIARSRTAARVTGEKE